MQFPKVSTREYLLVFLLLVTSGFTAGNMIPGKAYVLTLAGIVLLPPWYKIRDFKYLLVLLGISLLVGFYHFKTWRYVGSALSIYPILFLGGFATTKLLKWKFKYAYFNIMYVISLIGLFFHLLNVIGIHVDLLHIPAYKSIFIYNCNENDFIRNFGPFWEPGAYSGYLNLIPLFFFTQLDKLWKYHRKKVLVLLVALLSTMSTQGYMIFALIILFYILSDSGSKRVKSSVIFALPFFVIIFYGVYITVPFLHEKITDQHERFLDWNSEESLRSADRAVTTMVDLSIIEEYPLLGKTDDQARLYSEFPTIMHRINYLDGHYGSGSGTTSFIAANGIIFFFLLLWGIFRNLQNYYGNQVAVVIVTLILIMGFGEQFFSYIMFLSLPFLEYEKRTAGNHAGFI